jgi:opacity protein-like surface antigen
MAAPLYDPMYVWTGPYVGLEGGGGFGNNNFSFIPQNSGAGSNLFSSFSHGSTFDQGTSGFIAGGHFGYDYQWGHFVAGFEGAIDATNIGAIALNPLAPTVPPNTSYKTNIDWTAALTPRLGYAWGNFLPYVKGGLALGGIYNKLVTTNGPESFGQEQMQLGWTAGIGLDYATADNWVLGVEYDYYDLGKSKYGGQVEPDTTWPLAYYIHPTFSSVLVRLSYRFAEGGAGVPPAPSSAPTLASWTGPYAGLEAGGGWGSGGYAFPNDAGSFSSFAPQTGGGAFSQSLSGALAGGHVGYDYQWGIFVLGLETSIDWSNLSGKTTDPFAPTVSPNTTYKTNLDWLVAATPRLGVAWNNFMPYVKAGLAVGGVDTRLNNPAGPTAFGQEQAQLGWTIGVGLNYAFTPNWIFGVEYDYYDLGTAKYGGTAEPYVDWPLTFNIQPTFSKVEARVSYKF